jgi:hypothetical protein
MLLCLSEMEIHEMDITFDMNNASITLHLLSAELDKGEDGPLKTSRSYLRLRTVKH